MDQTWISSGEAARMLGYSRGQFVAKFDGLIPSIRIGNGHRRWLKEAVEKLCVISPLPQAG